MTHPINPIEFPEALRTLRSAKCWLLFFIGACLLLQLGAFVSVDFFGVIDSTDRVAELKAERAEALEPVDASDPATQPTTQVAGGDENAELWYESLHWVLPATKFLALVSSLLLVLTVMFSVKLSLIGRVGGPAGFMSAFYWSLLLFVALIPWQQILDSAIVCGATFNLDQLVNLKPGWQDAETPMRVWTYYYARFLAYPAVALLISLVVAAKFARGYRPLKNQVSMVVSPTPSEE